MVRTRLRSFGPSIHPGMTRRQVMEKRINFINFMMENNLEEMEDPWHWDSWRMHMEYFLEILPDEELDKLYMGA